MLSAKGIFFYLEMSSTKFVFFRAEQKTKMWQHWMWHNVLRCTICGPLGLLLPLAALCTGVLTLVHKYYSILAYMCSCKTQPPPHTPPPPHSRVTPGNKRYHPRAVITHGTCKQRFLHPNDLGSLHLLKIISLHVYLHFIYYDNCLKGHMQRKISKPQNFEKMKISIYKIDMQNVKSHRVL